MSASTGARLSRKALDILKNAGFTKGTWAAYCYGYDGALWGGDRCGCPDDRCIGYHHEAGDECGCLDALLEGWMDQRCLRAQGLVKR